MTSRERMMKYMAISMAFIGVASRIYMWFVSASDPASEEGDNIGPKEITELQGVVTDAINQGFMSANIPVMAQVTLTYVGE